MFDVLVTEDGSDCASHIPEVRVIGNEVWQDGDLVTICKNEERANELAFSIVSAAVGFRVRVMGLYN